MPVFLVECTYTPNGVRRSRPIVAVDASEARDMAAAEWDADGEAFQWRVTARPDPDGEYQRELEDAEKRRVIAEYFR